MAYLIFKALHIVFMVTWFAALFYLPRLYVYHATAQAEGDQASIERLTVMEKKLYTIGHIGMGFMLVFGFLLLWAGGWAAFGKSAWLHIKLTLVALLIGYYVWCGKIKKQFAAGHNNRSHVFYRWFNEVPAVFLIVIVLLAVLKPTFS